MEFQSTKQGNAVILAAKGRMDATTSTEFEVESAKFIDGGEKSLIIDLSGVEYISSAGLRSILVVAKKVKAAQGKIFFCNLSGMVKEVFTISGFAAMFTLCESVDDALQQC